MIRIIKDGLNPSITYKFYEVRRRDEIKIIAPLAEKLFVHQAKHARKEFQEFFSSITMETWVYPDYQLEVFPYKHAVVILAEDQERQQKIGFAYAVINEDDIGKLKLLYLDENYRGKGIGKMLFDESIQFLKQFEPDEIQIYVSDGNNQAIQFYVSRGFSVQEIVRDGMVTKLSNKNKGR